MSSVQDHINARKRRLEHLRAIRNDGKISPESDNDGNDAKTVETLSLQVEKESLDKFKNKASQIIHEAVNDDKSFIVSSEKAVDGTENMATSLQQQLDELDRLTDAKIRSLVRKRIFTNAAK